MRARWSRLLVAAAGAAGFVSLPGCAHRTSRHAHAVAALTMPVDADVGSLSAVALPGDSVVVAWSEGTRAPAWMGRDAATSRVLHVGMFCSDAGWSHVTEVVLEDGVAARLFAARGACYALCKPSRRLFRVSPDFRFTVVNRLDPPIDMAWQRVDGVLVGADSVALAATGLVPGAAGRVRHVVGVGLWRLGGERLSWTELANLPAWPRGGLELRVDLEDGRPVVVSSEADSTDHARAKDGSVAHRHFVRYALGADGTWRARPPRPGDDGSPAAVLAVPARLGLSYEEWTVRGLGGRAAALRNVPADHRFALASLPNWLQVLALREPSVEKARHRASFALVRTGGPGGAAPARLEPDAPIAGHVERASGVPTSSGGVFVYETTPWTPWARGTPSQLHVLRFDWPE